MKQTVLVEKWVWEEKVTTAVFQVRTGCVHTGDLSRTRLSSGWKLKQRTRKKQKQDAPLSLFTATHFVSLCGLDVTDGASLHLFLFQNNPKCQVTFCYLNEKSNCRTIHSWSNSGGRKQKCCQISKWLDAFSPTRVLGLDLSSRWTFSIPWLLHDTAK